MDILQVEEDLLHQFMKTRTPRKSNMSYLDDPRDTYRKPILTSHEYGWRPTHEIFGQISPLSPYQSPRKKKTNVPRFLSP